FERLVFNDFSVQGVVGGVDGCDDIVGLPSGLDVAIRENVGYFLRLRVQKTNQEDGVVVDLSDFKNLAQPVQDYGSAVIRIFGERIEAEAVIGVHRLAEFQH